METLLSEVTSRTGDDEFSRLKKGISERLKAMCATILQKTKLQAEVMGKRNAFLEEIECQNWVNNITNEHRELKEEIKRELSPDSLGPMGKSNTDECNNQLKNLEREHVDIMNSIALDPMAGQGRPPKIKWYEPLIKWLPMVILLAESCVEAMAFQLLLGALVVSVGVSLAFSVARYLLINYIINYLMKTKEAWKRRAVLLVTFLLAAFIYYWLGELRVMYMELIEHEIKLGALFFMILSLTFLGGAFAGEWWHLMRKPMLEEKEKLHDEFAEYQEKIAKRDALEVRIASKKREREIFQRQIILRMATSDTFFERLENANRTCISSSIAVYLQFRAGRDHEPIPPYFKSITIPHVVEENEWSVLRKQKQ